MQNAILGLFALGLVACATHQQTGALTGAAAGAAIGGAVGDTTGAVIGALVGAFAGSEIGRRLDERDRMETARVLEYAPEGDTRVWVNPDSGQRWSVTPHDTYQGPGGSPCREFVMQGYDPYEEEIYGTACRRPDGSWEVVDSTGK